MNFTKIMFVLVIQINLSGTGFFDDDRGGNGLALDAEKPLTYDEETAK